MDQQECIFPKSVQVPAPTESQPSQSDASIHLETYPDMSAAMKDILEEDINLLQGTTFDPNEELKKLMTLPTADRRHAINEYKRKLACQLQGFGRMREALIREIRSRTAIRPEELEHVYQKFKMEYGFPPQTDEIADRLIIETVRRSGIVNDLREENIEPSDACKIVFGFIPQGLVKVTYGPVTINFQFNDSMDFAKAYASGIVVTDEQKKDIAARVGGFFLKSSYHSPTYNGIVIGLNECDVLSPTFAHEQEHAYQDILNGLLNPVEIVHNPSLPSESAGNDIKELTFTKFFLEHRSHALLNVKDEILAFKRGNNFTDTHIVSTLLKTADTGGLYDYTAKIRKILQELSQEHYTEDTISLMKTVMDRILVKEYQEEIEEACNAFNWLLSMGFTRENCIDILSPIPIEKWSKVSHRIVEGEKLDPSLVALLKQKYPQREYKEKPQKTREQKKLHKKQQQEQIDAIRRTLEFYSQNKDNNSEDAKK